MKIAVISDIHIGPKSISEDLCTLKEGKKDVNFLDRFEDFIRTEGINVDYLILPGDVTEISSNEEIVLANSVIPRILDVLSVEKENVILAPGNHEQDFSSINPVDLGSEWQCEKYEYVLNDCVYKDFVEDENNHVFNSQRFCIKKYNNIAFVAYNTSWDDMIGGDVTSHGMVDVDDLRLIQNKLDGFDGVKIFVLHHHIKIISNPIARYKDFSVINNADVLLDFLHENSFTLAVHGHKHLSKINVDCNSSMHPVTILASGSFSATLPSAYQGHSANQFHVIDIESLDGNNACGFIKSWAYVIGKGWIKGTDVTGLKYQEEFGYYINEEICSNYINEIVENNYAGQQIVKWSDIVGVNEKLKYVNEDVRDGALKRVSSGLGYVVMSLRNEQCLFKGDT